MAAVSATAPAIIIIFFDPRGKRGKKEIKLLLLFVLLLGRVAVVHRCSLLLQTE